MKVYQITDKNTCIYNQKVIWLNALPNNIKDGLDMGRYVLPIESILHVEFKHFQRWTPSCSCLELRADDADYDVKPAETNAI